jgi:methylthioribose-1-phosphate isomerase
MTSVEWVAGNVRFIDQTKLPHEERYVESADYRVVGEAIKKLQIRGAPAIGIAAAFAVCLAVNDQSIASAQELEKEFTAAANYLSQTRPTAVNLFAALTRMRRVYKQFSPLGVIATRLHLLEEAIGIHQEDVEACRKIGKLGATLLNPGATILTHCNTGALATGGEGTALSIITTAAKDGKIRRVFVDETRPLLQGARLTSWELIKQEIETILITDSTAGYLLQQSQVSAVIVGADRIAANGDVANKIGTYPLAVLAERHMIPFYVAAPTSTVDTTSKSGAQIPIEERAAEEITHIAGIHVAAEGVRVYAPAFDITPNQLVTAIVTEAGILRPPYNVSIERLKLLGGGIWSSGL